MMAVNNYVKRILKKRGWTLQRFADEINNIKLKIGIESKTTKQNISNYLNAVDEKHTLRPKQLVIWEKALDLPYDTLVSMVEPVKSKNGIKEYEKIKESVRNESICNKR